MVSFKWHFIYLLFKSSVAEGEQQDGRLGRQTNSKWFRGIKILESFEHREAALAV